MSREKQIEEMAKVLCEDCARDTLPCVLTKTARMCESVKEQAEALYNAGYRKQSENTVEVVRCKDCEYWTEVSFDPITEWHWGECRKPLGDYRDCDTAEHDFCSYGEAKMKGGAE